MIANLFSSYSLSSKTYNLGYYQNKIFPIMKIIKSLKLGILLLLCIATVMTSCEKDDEVQPQQNIAEIASADANFTILVDALTRTGLVSAVSGTTELTVFAPTNAAFEKAFTALNVADLDGLESALGNAGLQQVLLYHVLGAEVMASEVTTGFISGQATRTTGGTDFLTMFVDASNGVRINNKATVTQADLDASNGVIHVIDEVILPLDIVDLAILSPVHAELVGALGSANLVTALQGDGPFTVFAPVDQAFMDIQSTVAGLDMDQLATVLTYHVVTPANVRAADVTAGAVSTLSTQMITLDHTDGVTITDQGGGVSTVAIADLQGTNGVIHAVDRVLIPEL